ncbi:MAG: response regulator [Spirochaetota bacterium]
MNKAILFVDDDINLLDSMKRSLRSMTKEWGMDFVLSAAEALNLVATKTYNVIVTDFKMPGMDGLELLRKVKEVSPLTKRVLLSGQSEAEVYEKARQIVDRYLSKPCDIEEILKIMRHDY